MRTRVERLLLGAVAGALACWVCSLRTAPEGPLPLDRDWASSLPAMLLLTVIGCLLASALWQPRKRRTTAARPQDP